MAELDLVHYSEVKPHYLKMVIWRVFNAVIFPILPRGLRTFSLRLFGAKIGKDCLFSRLAKFYAPWNFKCGNAVCIGPRAEIYNKDVVGIGNNVVISQDAWLCTASHDTYSIRMSLVTKLIKIGNNVWIAAKASILPGVTIGNGAVVGACAVVAKDVAPWTVVAGNPARMTGPRELSNDISLAGDDIQTGGPLC